MGKEVLVCDNFDGINSLSRILFNGLVPKGEKDLILSRQLQEIIELKEGKLEERKILGIQIMIENSTGENKSFYDKLKLFSLDDELKRLFLVALDLYIRDKNHKVLRHIFTHENGDGNFALNIPLALISSLSSKITSLDLFGDFEILNFNGIEYKKNGNYFFNSKGEKLDVFFTGNKKESQNDIDLSEYLTPTEIYDYCRYFNIDTETCKKDMILALELLEGMPENIRQFVGSNNILLLSIFREVQRVGLNYINFKQIIAMAIIESEFGESNDSGSYKGPIQIGEVALRVVKKGDNGKIVEEIARFLGKNPTKLSIQDCSKIKVGLTLGTLYLRNAELETSDKKLPKTPHIPEKYLKEVNAKLAAKGIKIDETIFKVVVSDIKNNEQAKVAFYSLQRYNGSKSKVSYALAIMCIAKKLEI